MPKRTQAERREATRGALVAAARALFAEQGYADTATTQVVEQAGVTRGALYHHFADKVDLFRAVYEAVETDVVAEVVAAAEAAGVEPLARLRAATRRFLDLCLEPEVHRITLIDAPAVLGWAEWKRLDAQYGLGVTTVALQHAMEAGALAPRPVEPLAHIVLGAMTEGALLVARSDDPQAAKEEVAATLDALLEGLRP